MTNVVRSPQREKQLREFWPTSVPTRVLAEEWMCTCACISTWAKSLGLPSREGRKYQIRLAGNTIPIGDSYMRREAEMRDLTIGELERRILQAIVEGKLVGAVLDDADEEKQAA